MSEALAKQQNRFFGFLMLGPKTRQRDRFFEEKDGAGRRKHGTLSEQEFEKEMKIFRNDILLLGTWPALVLGFMTVIAAGLGWRFFGSPAMAIVLAVGWIASALVFRKLRARNGKTWDRLEKQIRGTA